LRVERDLADLKITFDLAGLGGYPDPCAGPATCGGVALTHEVYSGEQKG
jgi:hypothetical protein